MSHKRKLLSHSPKPYTKRSRPTYPELYDNDTTSNPYNIQSRVDPTYGQRGAFPGLDSPTGEDDLFHGPANDGLEYLRMVRYEARGVPNLLVAPSPNEMCMNGEGVGSEEDHGRGYYEDGAYTALPPPGVTGMEAGLESEEEDGRDPQEAYYAALLNRFLALRTILRSSFPPPPRLLNGTPWSVLEKKASRVLGSTHKEWRLELMHTKPSPGLMAAMSQECVIRGLTRLETLLSGNNLLRRDEGRLLGAWCWALLGRCRDLGEMSSEEVAVLRMVGKTALRLGRKMRMKKRMEGMEEDQEEGIGEVADEDAVEQEDGAEDGDGRADAAEEGNGLEGGVELEMEDGEMDCTRNTSKEEQVQLMTAGSGGQRPVNGNSGQAEETNGKEDMEEGEIGEDNEPVDALAEARRSVLARLDSTSSPPGEDRGGDEDVEARAHSMLDMIVTIIGEVFGQRDLLDAREVWGE